MRFTLEPLTGFLASLDRRPVPAFLGRLALTAGLLRLWDIRRVPSPIRIQDVDPSLLDLARQQGLDLMQPGAWPSWTLHVAVLLGYGLAMTLLWWSLSRLRSRVARRMGSGAVALGLVVAGGLALVPIGTLGALAVRHGNDLFDGVAGAGGAPIWGGWLQTPLYGTEGPSLPVFLALTATAVEALLLAFQGRLALREAREGALRGRLMPHFLFNALNTLHAQVEQDPAGAQETLERLGRLLRQVLEATDQPLIELGQELAMVEDLLGLERRRLGARLRVELEVPEALLGDRIPVLGLQVLVENAVKHALEPRVEGGTLAIRAWREGRDTVVSVTDSGDGTSRAAAGTGRGLANLRARLAHPGDLTLGPVAGGFRASFRFRQA